RMGGDLRRWFGDLGELMGSRLGPEASAWLRHTGVDGPRSGFVELVAQLPQLTESCARWDGCT
ncbi:hypothetical protein ACLEPN_44285, partial [Myxococcus sp. 1LA]